MKQYSAVQKYNTFFISHLCLFILYLFQDPVLSQYMRHVRKGEELRIIKEINEHTQEETVNRGPGTSSLNSEKSISSITGKSSTSKLYEKVSYSFDHKIHHNKVMYCQMG